MFGVAIAVMAYFGKRHATAASAKSRAVGKGAAAGSAAAPAILVHDINDDRCTGCDACVAVCPTNVLDLINNKSRVLRFADCIQCEACMWACPTDALVMHPEGSQPPPLKVPDIDQNFQTRVPGQYLIGEVAGKPLVKSAANLGRGVIEHALAHGLTPMRQASRTHVDVAIVGAGPGGLSAALTCLQRGLSYVLLDKEHGLASTIARYPKGKFVMAEPYDTVNLSLLPVFDSSKEQLIATWQDLIGSVGLRVNLSETVETIARRSDGQFDLKTGAASYRAQRVVIASGTRGKPRTLGVPGESLPKVHTLLDDPDAFRGRAVLVVGGGDSAVEAAMALADAGAVVNISYRGKSFNRAQAKNRQSIDSYAAQAKLKVRFGSNVVEFADDSVTLQLADGAQKRYRNDAAFVLIGSDPPIAWLEKFGVRFVEKPHQFTLGKTDEFVLRVLPTASACAETASEAAAAITSRRPRTEVSFVAPLPPPTGARQAWRRATSMFSAPLPAVPASRRAMTLSEFAAGQKRGPHSGRGRRDELPAKERARQLRSLRDEGARLADEDSRLIELPAWERNTTQDERHDDGAIVVGLARANLRRSPDPNDEPSVVAPPPGAPAAKGPPPVPSRRAQPSQAPPAQSPTAKSREQAIAMLGEGLPTEASRSGGLRPAPRPSAAMPAAAGDGAHQQPAPGKSIDDVDFDLD